MLTLVSRGDLIFFRPFTLLGSKPGFLPGAMNPFYDVLDFLMGLLPSLSTEAFLPLLFLFHVGRDRGAVSGDSSRGVAFRFVI